jgi:hypothetical protein
VRKLWLLFPAVMLLPAGCGGKAGSGEVVMHPVSGQVLYDGKPMAGVEVTLLPTDAPMVPTIPRNPRAVTDAQGRFVIGTFTASDGAAEGGYQILCHWPKTAPGAEGDQEVDPSEDDRLLRWYDPMNSKFSMRVKPGENVIPPLQLVKHSQPPPKSDGVPGRN